MRIIVFVGFAEDLCKNQESGVCLVNQWKPLLLVVPLRLGLNEINPIYVKGLQVIFFLNFRVNM